MVNVLTSCVINRPLSKVAAYASNPGNAPLWYANIKSVEWKTAENLEVGTRVAFIAEFLGRKLAYTYEITEFEPNKKLVMSTADGPFPMKTIYTWEKVDESKTRMTLQNTGNPTGFSKLSSPFLSQAMKKANEKDLHRIKDILEGV